ncbi:MAG TPA: UBP-type zinc finger domain-containing protein [Anaerolineaceae bacterium]|nr:UBP-type zinc finger domain-containing protein [Anaerolineaceae bacterium]
MKEETCKHVKGLKDVTPSGNGCEECMKMGDTWVHLRLCETCGHVGCCDQSKNKHATKHFHATGHPVIKSFEPGEDWGYCYVDDIYYDMLPVNVGSHHH